MENKETFDDKVRHYAVTAARIAEIKRRTQLGKLESQLDKLKDDIFPELNGKSVELEIMDTKGKKRRFVVKGRISGERTNIPAKKYSQISDLVGEDVFKKFVEVTPTRSIDVIEL